MGHCHLREGQSHWNSAVVWICLFPQGVIRREEFLHVAQPEELQVPTVIEELGVRSSSGGTCLDILDVRRFGYLSLATWRSILRLRFAFLHGHCETMQQNALANFGRCLVSMAKLFLIASRIVAFVSSLIDRSSFACSWHEQHLFSQFITDCVVC